MKKKTVLRPKKEKKIIEKEICLEEKEKKEYLDSDLEDPDNKRIYENVIKRIENKEINIDKKEKKKERNNRYKEMENKVEKKLRRKTVDRGGKYNNIQARYIIYSKKDIKFHIVEPMNVSFDKPLMYDKNRTNRKEPKGNVKVTYKSSCDNFKVRKKKKNKEKTVIYYHCAEIKQKDFEKKRNKVEKNINNINIIKVPKEKEKKEIKKELNEEDIIDIVEAILNQIALNEKKNHKNIYINEIENYLLKKEEEKKLKEIIKMMKTLKENEKEEIIYLLTYILNDNEFIEKLKEETGIKSESIEKLLEEYRRYNTRELDDNKIIELTEKMMKDLMKEYPINENEKRLEIINRAANNIILLNKNDQDKIIKVLKNLKKNEYQKETFDKLCELVDNLNSMRLYLFKINQNNLDTENNKELSSKDIENLKENIKSKLFNENEVSNNNLKNIDKIAFRLSNLSKKDQNNILNEINVKANETSRKSLDKLKQVINNIRILRLFRSTIKNKKLKNDKKKVPDENRMREIAINLKEKLLNNRNSSEKLINNNEEKKIKNLATSVNVNYGDDKKKFLTKSIFNNNNNKMDIEKLKNSLINQKDININNKSILTSQFYMMKSFGIIDLNIIQLNDLIETFCKDLFTDKIMDINKKEENLNLIANLIKELDEDNQKNLIEILEKKPEALNNKDLIKDLKDRIIKLNLLKDELREERDEFIGNDMEFDADELIEDEEDFDVLDELNETMTVEISTEEIEEDDIKEMCEIFKINYEDNNGNDIKNKIKDNNSLNILEGSLSKLNDKAQKKIADKLEENLENEEEKNQLNDIRKNLKKLNSYKKLGKILKERKEKNENDFEKEKESILKLNNNGNKNLDEENIKKLSKEIKNYLFDNIHIDFDKNEIIENYIKESKKEDTIWKSAAKIVNLSDKDKKYVLDEIKKKTNNEKNKINIYNKLLKEIEILEKIKNMKNDVELKKKDLIEVEEVNLNHGKKNEKLESFIQILNKDNIRKNDIVNVVNEIINYDEINQEFFLNNFREKLTCEKKDFIIKQIETLLGKKKIQNKFAYKVLEKYMRNIIIEKVKNEKKYGIFIDDKDKRGVIILKNPHELNEDKFNELKNNFIEDLNELKKENEDKNKEKKLEEIADVINSLDRDDKMKILTEIKNNFDLSNDNNLYNKFMNIFEKRKKIYNEQKLQKKKESKKEIEDKKKEEENNLLYSFVDLKEKNINSSDIVIYSENENVPESNNDNIKDNSIDKNFTFHIGYLETEETY